MAKHTPLQAELITLDDVWFERYQMLKYSLDDWYVAISRRFDVYNIFNEYFQQKDAEKRKSPSVLSHTGNKKFNWDDFIAKQDDMPDDQIIQTHILLQIYVEHGCITSEIAIQLREEINHTTDSFCSFMKKMAAMLVDISNKDSKSIIIQKINDIKYKIHESETIKTPAFLDKLLLTMNNLNAGTEEVKVRYFNKAKLADMKKQILSGSILDIDDLSRKIIYTDAPYGELYYEENNHSSFPGPIKTFTIFNMIQAREKESEEQVQAVIQMFSEGQSSFFTRHRRNEMITVTEPDEFNSGHLIEKQILPFESKARELFEQLHFFGWGYSRNKNTSTPVEIYRSVCSVDINESDRNLIYSFMRWIKHQRGNTPGLNKRLNAREARVLVSDLQNTLKNVLDFEDIAKTLIECECQNLLCYLDYTILTLMQGVKPALSKKARRSNSLCADITTLDKATKEKLKILLADTMNTAFLKRLWELAYCS